MVLLQQPHLSEQLQLLQQSSGSAAAGIGGNSSHLTCPSTSSGASGSAGQGTASWQRTNAASVSGNAPPSSHYQRQQTAGASFGTLQQPQSGNSSATVLVLAMKFIEKF